MLAFDSCQTCPLFGVSQRRKLEPHCRKTGVEQQHDDTLQTISHHRLFELRKVGVGEGVRNAIAFGSP
eukprot:239217-Lingulodinium_polyedra.AAC.1